MTVKMTQGKFIIEGKEVFLYGGEFHYFRVPKTEWKDRIDKLIEAGCNLVSTYVPWVWHEIEEGVYDLTGETSDKRDLKSFLELVKEAGLYCIVRPGPYVMAEVRYEGVPDWLLDRYPEVIARRRDGGDHPTRVVTFQHPEFLSRVKTWYNTVNRIIGPMQITHGGPVIMYQLCNEIGMLHWVTNTSDYNEHTLREFTRYLARTYYHGIEQFNEAWKLDETSFEAFVDKFRNGLPADYPSVHLLWGQFWREYIKDYVGILREFAKSDRIDVPFIVNVHGFKDYSIYSRGVDYPIGISQLYKTAEFPDVVLAGDFYPGHIGYDNYHDLVLASAYTKAASAKDQPLFSAEFQSGRLADKPRLYPQDLDLNTRTCVAHGMNALNYYMFVAGENYENIGLFGRRHEWQAPIDSRGGLRPNYAKARHLGQLFQTIGTRLLNAPKRVHTYVGFNPNDYMTETVDDRDRSIWNEVIGKREHFSFDGVLRLLVGANIHFEAIDLLKDFTAVDIPTLWVFSTSYMDIVLQRKLAKYVEEGGKLILYPEIPRKDMQGEVCSILRDALRLGDWEVVGGTDTVDVLGIDSVHVKQRLKCTDFDGEVVASFTRKGGNEVAAFRKSVGMGEILVLGIAIGQEYAYQLDVIAKLAECMGIRAHLTSDNRELSLVERTDGTLSFLFIGNYDEIEQAGTLYSQGEPLFDGQTVVLPSRSSVIFVKEFQLHPEIVIEFATVELLHVQTKAEAVEITVAAIGNPGSLKLRTNGNWKVDREAEYTDKGMTIRGIAGSMVLSMNKTS